jgi:hypothetical protein
MYDLEIHYPDGRLGAVEVTAAEDEALAATQGAIGSRPLLHDARLRRGWFVVLSERPAVNLARTRLPDLLVQLEAAGLEQASVFDGQDWDQEQQVLQPEGLLRAAHVQTARSSDGLPAGTVAITGPMRVAWLSRDPEDVVTFVERFIESRPSDVAKLGRSGADERHLFIWSGTQSKGLVELRALGLDVLGLPSRRPELPAEVTHVWVAPVSMPPSRIVVWGPDTGWQEAGTVT